MLLLRLSRVLLVEAGVGTPAWTFASRGGSAATGLDGASNTGAEGGGGGGAARGDDRTTGAGGGGAARGALGGGAATGELGASGRFAVRRFTTVAWIRSSVMLVALCFSI